VKNLISISEKNSIDQFCRKYKIFKYTITSDGLVDVPDNVNISGKRLTEIPIKFGRVDGSFYCQKNDLTTLIGLPTYIGGDLICYQNRLTNLVGAPNTIIGYTDVSNNMGLTTTYSGDTDIDLGTGSEIRYPVYIEWDLLPKEIESDKEHIRLILKYQRHFFIWNDDFTLNIDNFNDLIDEIKEGLQ